VFLGYSNLHKGYKCLDISTWRLYISRDIVFDETVFPFASLHSNAGARLREEINLLPLSLQPFNLHFHEGHELQGPGDVDPTNSTNTAAESFLQSADQDFTSDDDSSVFPAHGMDTGDDFPAHGADPDAGTDPELLLLAPNLLAPNLLAPISVLLSGDPPRADLPQRDSRCRQRLCYVQAGAPLLAGPLTRLCQPPPPLRPDHLWQFLPAMLTTLDRLDHLRL
jgi:hypothetical protein